MYSLSSIHTHKHLYVQSYTHILHNSFVYIYLLFCVAMSEVWGMVILFQGKVWHRKLHIRFAYDRTKISLTFSSCGAGNTGSKRRNASQHSLQERHQRLLYKLIQWQCVGNLCKTVHPTIFRRSFWVPQSCTQTCHGKSELWGEAWEVKTFIFIASNHSVWCQRKKLLLLII